MEKVVTEGPAKRGNPVAQVASERQQAAVAQEEREVKAAKAEAAEAEREATPQPWRIPEPSRP